MTSPRGVASAIIILLVLPAAIVASQTLGDRAAGITIHVMLGASMLALALATLDFSLPRWVNVIGAASAGAFGAIFLLQALSLALNDALQVIAFDILGNEPERFLPLGIIFWSAALLLRASSGRTRLMGWAIVPAIVGLQAAILVGPVIGIEVGTPKIAFLLPFVWLLLESAKAAPSLGGREPARSELAAAVAS
jgi:hypothetical protein